MPLPRGFFKPKLEKKNPIKKVLIFQEMELSHILGNGNPEKLLIFQEANFRT